MKTIFFGSSKYVIPTIEMLNAGFGLALVVTTEKDPLDTVPSFCNANNIPYLSVKNLKDENVLEKIKNEKALVGVLGYFGLIVPQELLDMFPKGIINIHPSLLPKYRGPTPVQTTILNGDTETGTSIILLDKEVDHGPILIQKKLDIDPVDTTDSLHAKLFSLGAELIKEVLPMYLADGITLQAQDHSAASFTKHLSKQSGQFEIDNPPNKENLDRMIRAYFPWPTAWTVVRIKNKEVRIKLLPGQKLQMEGGKPMGVKDFQNGYPDLKPLLEKLI
jgi:methionyl-tRNA formyltransferase